MSPTKTDHAGPGLLSFIFVFFSVPQTNENLSSFNSVLL